MQAVKPNHYNRQSLWCCDGWSCCLVFTTTLSRISQELNFEQTFDLPAAVKCKAKEARKEKYSLPEILS
uniref:Transposase n=1 Tax=Mesocestoides corti TaxID=53468 RepID=A0A5K3FTJ2_MESCO